MLLLTLACADPVTCGPGTVLKDTTCLADAGPDETGNPDSAHTGDTDTGQDADTGEDTETGPDTDTGGDTTDTAATPLEVYILAGQSNMDGYSYRTGLPPSYWYPDADVPLYWSGWGEFRGLQPASYGGEYLTGPEVSFGHRIHADGHAVALVKHAVGGTDLSVYWNPGESDTDPANGPGWTVLVQSLDQARRELNASGVSWRWAGFLWMQGESDATNRAQAAAYEENLTHLIARIREETGVSDLPAAIGLISTETFWTYNTIVRAAEQAVADADPTVVTVETDDLRRNPLDAAHYDGPAIRVMGERFAQAIESNVDVPAGGAPQAAMSVTTYAEDYDFNGTCGWSFTLDRAVTVSDVGGFGPETSLGTSVDLGVWDDAGSLVLRANLPSWYEAPTSWRSGYWYVAVEPVTLEPGTYRIGYVSWAGDTDRYGNNAEGTMGEGFTFGVGVYVSSYWLAYPSAEAAGEGYSFVGPNLLYTLAE